MDIRDREGAQAEVEPGSPGDSRLLEWGALATRLDRVPPVPDVPDAFDSARPVLSFAPGGTREMSDERSGAEVPEGARVKVTDRRRFTAGGEPLAPGEEATAGPAGQVEEGAGRGDPAGARGPDTRDARLAEQAARIDELARAYAALVEDNKGFRQRLERERTRVVEAERASVAQALLDAADDLERALAAVANAGDGVGPLASLVEGVRLSLGALHARIAALGAQRIPVQGLPFDPHVAEAVDAVAVADEALDGVVVQEVRAGWRIGDRVLRPARVRVGRIARA